MPNYGIYQGRVLQEIHYHIACTLLHFSERRWHWHIQTVKLYRTVLCIFVQNFIQINKFIIFFHVLYIVSYRNQKFHSALIFLSHMDLYTPKRMSFPIITESWYYFASQRPVASSQKPSLSSSFCGGALNNGEDGVP